MLLKEPDELGLLKDVAFHGAERLFFAGAGRKPQQGVKRIEGETVMMRSASRRTRAAVADIAEAILPLDGAPGKLRRCLDAFAQRGDGRVKVEDHPVRKGAQERVRIIHDQREGTCLRWRAAPGERW